MNAYQIINEIKTLTQKIKEQKKPSSTAYAQSDFIEKLLQMERDYNMRTKKSMPDFEKMLPPIQPPEWEFKDERGLEQEAKDYVSSLAKQKRKELEKNFASAEEQLLQKQSKAHERRQQELEKSHEDFLKTQKSITQRMSRQGLTHSSIKESMLDQNINRYIDSIEAIRKEYELYQQDLTKQIELVQTAKEEAILDFDIKLASEYEKKLKALKEDQLKALDEMIKYNKTVRDQQLKRQEQIKELQENWLKQQSLLEEEKLKKEFEEGYSGEKAAEMEKRYRLALDYYKNMYKKRALELIEKDKDILKSTLGLYYSRLIKEIENKEK
ncbi:MAG: hypothetical protein QM214_01645 [Bacillota bacterium]|jgi:hypothetical protein|nr:hypothetical protein [Bacillota bacterium]HHU43802.1 hypothetical protein [Clostridiales bacterium]